MKKFIKISVIFLCFLWLFKDMLSSPNTGDWIAILILELIAQDYLQNKKL